MFSWLQLAIGAYLIFCGITGKGKVFDNDFLKIPREEYVKKLRILASISGACLSIASVLEMLGWVIPGTTLGWIVWALGLASIVPMMVYTSKATDRKAAKAAQNESRGMPQKKEDSLRAAFVFDDDEEAAKPDDPGEDGN